MVANTTNSLVLGGYLMQRMALLYFCFNRSTSLSFGVSPANIYQPVDFSCGPIRGQKGAAEVSVVELNNPIKSWSC